MAWLDKIKNSPHYALLKESVQYRYDRRQFCVMCFFFGFCFLLFLVALTVDVDGALFTGLMSLGLLAVTVHHAYHWLGIFRHINSYHFYSVMLEQPRRAPRENGLYFKVAFQDRHGNWLLRETNSIFSHHEDPRLEDFNNKTALIGYNEATDRLIVIKRIEG